MSFISKVVDSVDLLVDGVAGAMRQGITDYCQLETVDSEGVLVSNDGSLISIVEIRGVRALTTGRDMFEGIVVPVSTSLQGVFQDSTHRMQVWFEIDPDRTKEEILNAQAPSRDTAKRLQLELDDLLEERAEYLSKWVDSERCFAALWTRPSGLSKQERKREAADRKRKVKDLEYTRNMQDPLRGAGALRNVHRSFVEGFVSEMGLRSVVVEQLGTQDALREIRRSIDPTFVNEEWVAALPGDRLNPSIRSRRASYDEWEVMSPPLSWQLCPRDATVVAENAVQIGDRIYAPMYIDLFPRDLHYFSTLLQRAKMKRLPWRVSFLIDGGGMDGSSMKRLAASILGFVSVNRQIKRSLEELQNFQESMSGVNVKIRVSMCTWANKGEELELSRRASDLATSFQRWGSAEVSEKTGDPLSGVMSSGLAMTQGSIGTPSIAPISDALAILPLSRPTSPWAHGPVLFRSPDGKLIPFEPYSGLQATWISLIFAPPGSGKSVLMNMHNLGLCLLDGLERLPRIAIIDIGPSSSGFISLIQEALPPDKRHYALHKRLRMIEEHSINPLDTQLCCRYPTPMEMGFLRNFMTLLGTDFTESEPPSGLPGMVAAILNEMYRRRSDKGDPNIYSEGSSELVDERMRVHNIHYDRKTTWWEVVDALFLAGEHHAAHQAQKFAVPLLTDAVSIAQDEKIFQRFGDAKTATGESLIQAFSRLLTDALDFFPVLSRPTRLDLGDARIVALDLDEVARGGGVVGDRVTAVMYMLARQVLAKDFYVNKESIADMPASQKDLATLGERCPVEAIKQYHSDRIDDISKDPKRICYDEFHRTTSASSVRQQVQLDMREGRKFRVDVMLASQSLVDFDDLMVEFCSSLYIMGGGSEITVRSIEERFSFQSSSEGYAIRNSLRSPRKGGGVFMTKFETNQGKYTMLLSATLGPIELWAFSTTATDAILRNRLYGMMGPARARQALARMYPGGSAAEEIKQRREALRENGALIVDGKEVDVIDRLAREIASTFAGQAVI